MDEIDELLEEGRILERRILRIKKKLQELSKITNINIDLDKWEVKK